MKLLIINIGGSSTKLAVYENENELTLETIRHSSQELNAFDSIWAQYEFRKKVVEDFLKKHNYKIEDFSAIVSRGAVVKPLQSGTYLIDKALLADAQSGKYGAHPSGLGCEIAYALADNKIPCLTVDPPCVDEMIDIARITGWPDIKRVSFFQVLNHKAKGRELAEQLGTVYEKLNLVIAHLGSGISVASHKQGQVIDVTNGLEGDSPMGLDRVGTLAAGDWMRYCLSGKKSKEELSAIINGGGGIKAHLGTNSALEVEEMIDNGNSYANQIYEAMAFQVAKGIGAASAALGTCPDGIIVTGGLANSTRFMSWLRARISWIAPLYVMPDDNEILSLAKGALRALHDSSLLKNY